MSCNVLFVVTYGDLWIRQWGGWKELGLTGETGVFVTLWFLLLTPQRRQRLCGFSHTFLQTCPWQGDWNQRIFKIPTNPNHSVLPQFQDLRLHPRWGSMTSWILAHTTLQHQRPGALGKGGVCPSLKRGISVLMLSSRSLNSGSRGIYQLLRDGLLRCSHKAGMCPSSHPGEEAEVSLPADQFTGGRSPQRPR